LLGTGAFTEKSLKEKAEISPELLETVLNDWRDRDIECLSDGVGGGKFWYCQPCINENQQCIRLTGTRNFFKEMSRDQIGNICKLFKLVFSDSVCTFYNFNPLDLREEPSLTPPWGVLGPGYSLRNCSFTRNNYSNHHALGKLAERLVEKGMLAAAGEDDHRDYGGAGQQPYPVDAWSE